MTDKKVVHGVTSSSAGTTRRIPEIFKQRPELVDGQWHTFLAESDADGQRIYIDGDRDRQLERAIAAEEGEVAP